MIRELLTKLRTRAKEMRNAFNAAIKAVAYHFTPAILASAQGTAIIVTSETGSALNVGKRYRLTSGHAPVFSLFTYFGNRR